MADNIYSKVMQPGYSNGMITQSTFAMGNIPGTPPPFINQPPIPRRILSVIQPKSACLLEGSAITFKVLVATADLLFHHTPK